jgi:hypothetical protein
MCLLGKARCRLALVAVPEKEGKVLGGERGASEFSLGLGRQKSSLAARSPTVPQVQLLSRRRPFLKSNSFPDHHGHTRRTVRAFSEDHLRRPHPAPPPSPTSLGLGDDVHGEGPDGRHSSRPAREPHHSGAQQDRRPHDPGRLRGHQGRQQGRNLLQGQGGRHARGRREEEGRKESQQEKVS